MSVRGIRARLPRGDVVLSRAYEDTDRWLLDAAYFPGGRADVGYLPRTEGEIAAILARHARVLALGAQSSLTGGATPAGGAVIATERLDRIELDAEGYVVRCGAGVSLAVLQKAADAHGLFLAPAPTYDGALVGGAVATNAAGAATFKYGTMRAAVLGLTVVLADGSVLDVDRGQVTAHEDGWFEIAALDGTVRRVPVPIYRMPDVPKCSAGYFARPGMDLVDLFVGSEGTLGIVTEVTLALTPRPAASVSCWLALPDEKEGFALAAALRAASRETWSGGDPNGLDIAAVEYMDRRCIELLLEDGEARRHGVPLHADDETVLMFPVDLRHVIDPDAAVDQLLGENAGDGPLQRLSRLLGDSAERLEAALPGDRTTARAFAAMREAVPTAVNHRVRDARLRDERIHKVAGDFIVPLNRFAESMDLYREGFRRRGLDHAVWGHISDGNVHPNVIPRSFDDVCVGKEAVLEMGEAVSAMGGSPLAEHGVGRHPVKQALLLGLYGEEGIEQMRAVKRSLDPDGKLAPGVLFPAPGGGDKSDG